MSSFYTPPNVRGTDKQIQYNEDGVLSASSDLTWDDSAKELGVGGDINLDDGGTYSTTLQMVTATANRTISFPDATGTVALVAGSSGQLTYNNAGANAGASTLTYDGSILTSSGRFINSYNATASSPAKIFTGTWFTGGTATTTKPQLLIEPTGTTSTAWSTDGTGLGVNAASGFSGRLLDLQTNGTSRMVVQGDGKFGLGTVNPAQLLHLNSSSANATQWIAAGTGYTSNLSLLANGSGGGLVLSSLTDSSASITNTLNAALTLGTNNAERARIDSDGRLLVGTSSGNGLFNGGTQNPQFQIEGTTGNTILASLTANRNDAAGPTFYLAHSRGTAAGGTTVLQSGDQLGILAFAGTDGTDYVNGATITANVDGTPGADDMPGRLVFSTTADGAASPTERMRIRNDGALWYGTTTGSIGTAAFGFVINDNVVEFAKNRAAANAVMTAYGNAGYLRIMGDGDAENTNNSYAGISDIKLKENIVDANSQWNDLKALQVRNYNFKAETGYSTHTQIGLIAQEVELVSPGLVGESIDDETGESTKSVNYSVLYMKAVKALQEAIERIETLEASNADLLARVSVLEQG